MELIVKVRKESSSSLSLTPVANCPPLVTRISPRETYQTKNKAEVRNHSFVSQAIVEQALYSKIFLWGSSTPPNLNDLWRNCSSPVWLGVQARWETVEWKIGLAQTLIIYQSWTKIKHLRWAGRLWTFLSIFFVSIIDAMFCIIPVLYWGKAILCYSWLFTASVFQ